MFVTDPTSTESSALSRTLVAIIGSLGMGLLFDLLFFGKLPGISFPLYVVLSLGFIFWAAHEQRRNIPKTALYMLPLLLFFSSMVFVRASELLTFFNVVLSVYLLGLFVVLVFKPRLSLYKFKDYLSFVFTLPLKALGRAGEAFALLGARNGFVARHQTLPQVVRGVLIAVPVVLLFVLLFSSADLVFRQYVADIFSFQVNAELVWRTFFVLAVALGFFGLFALIGRHNEPAQEAEKVPHGRGGLVEVMVVLGSLNVLFLSFIFIQLAYLFGGAANVVGDGFTYAEYARKGFFELIAVAGLSFLLIFVAERLLLREGHRHAMEFKVLSGALVVQVLIIMVSAFKRLQLYENAYGYTSLRLCSHIFIVWLAIVLLGMLYKIFTDQRESFLAFYLFVCVLVLFASLNFINVDGMVAHQNIGRYHATGKLDVNYLTNLSDDGVTEVTSLLDVKDEKLKAAIAQDLYVRRHLLLTENTSWQSTNLTRQSVLRALDERQAVLEQYKDSVTDPGYSGPGQ